MIIPKNYKRRVIAGIILIFFTILFFYWQSKKYVEELARGPDLYEELDLPITFDVLDSVSSGLYKFHHQFGHFPNVKGKYFLDSIKQYLNISHAYVYADSIDNRNDTILIKKKAGKIFKYKEYKHTYIGIGWEKLIFVYKRLNPDSFKLYSVGKNLIDENGEGDDVLFYNKK